MHFMLMEKLALQASMDIMVNLVTIILEFLPPIAFLNPASAVRLDTASSYRALDQHNVAKKPLLKVFIF